MKHPLLIVSSVMCAAGLFVQTAAAPPQPIAPPSLPATIAAWYGADAPPLDDETQRLIGADWSVNRLYQSAGQPPVGVYIAYYGSPRPGVSIHSPLNCLPGTGWEALQTWTLTLSASSALQAVPMRAMVVRKELDRALVLYWYDVHGRPVSSEASSRLWLLHDAFTRHRSDAALVRIVVPIGPSVDRAERIGRTFAATIAPLMTSLWS